MGTSTRLPVVLGLGTAWIATSAGAADVDPAVIELTRPASQVELGVGAVSQDSYKFGEYNGLESRGGYASGGVDLRGGDFDAASATRWRLTGRDLGLDTRSLSAQYGQQGRFRLDVGYDELRRNRSDSFNTPYIGAGTPVQTLPASWLVPRAPRVSSTAANARGLSQAVADSSALVAGVLTAPTDPQRTTSTALIAADLPAFHAFDLSTTRKRLEAGATFLAGSRWEFSVAARRENKDGAKPMGTVTRQTGADISTIVADPIDQRTDQLTAAAAWRDRKDFVQLSYTASSFRNNVDSLTWTNWADPTRSSTMSSAPDNEAHRFQLQAGKELGGSWRLAGSATYGRTTQNGLFLTDASTPLVPASSLHGLVETRAGMLRLTGRPLQDVAFGLTARYDERVNRTPVHTYAYYDANEAPGTANLDANFATALGVAPALLKSNANVNANRPYSHRNTQVSADADWRIAKGQSLTATLDVARHDRWCNGTWISCVNASQSQETTGRVDWRVQPASTFTARVSASVAHRAVDAYNENAFLALVPMAQVNPTTATGGASAYSFMLQNGWNGYGPAAGYLATTGNANVFFPGNNAMANAAYANQNRISELAGMRLYDMADRSRRRLRGAADWQATEVIAVHADLALDRDDFNGSRYGLLDSRGTQANVELSWTPVEQLAVSAFYTFEDRLAHSAGNTYTANSAATAVNGFTAVQGGCYASIALRNASNKTDPCTNWTAALQDRTQLLGLTIARSGLLHEKLDLGAQVVATRARSDNRVGGGNYANNPLAVAGAPTGTIAAFYIPATALPTIESDSVELRLNARYAISRNASLRLTYLYGDLSAADYAYQGLQLGGLAGVLPTLETAPRYVVHAFALAYTLRL